MTPVSGSKKKYTRGELFEVAELMNDTSIDREQLQRFKETRLVFERAEPNQIGAGDDDDKHANSIESPRTKLGRTVSSNQQLRIPQRISRMTSSPTLKYNRNTNHQQPSATGSLADERASMMKGDPISSQARAKYAELIESLSSSAGRQTERARQPVSRSASLNAWHHQPDEQRRSRPTGPTLFAPSRHEINGWAPPRDARNHSDDEPLSLPYVLTNTPGSSSAKIRPLRSMASDLDDFARSPIKRMGSFANAGPSAAASDQSRDGSHWNSNSNNEPNEDDEFDLNSMINITVLSDIKTIRQQEFHVQSSSSMSLAQQNNNRSKQIMKHQRPAEQKLDLHRNHQAAPTSSLRPLITRSRTATEFNYRGRYHQPAASDLGGRSRAAAHIHGGHSRAAPLINPQSNSTSPYQEPAGYDSIPCTYGWQYEERRLGQERAANKLTRQTSDSPIIRSQPSELAPKDERAAKIIETFKAQVLARAASASVPAAEPAVEKPSERKRSAEVAEKSLSSSSLSVEVLRLAGAASSDGEQKSIRPTTDRDRKDKAEPIDRTEAVEPLEAAPKQQKGSRIPIATSNISNIPRLISLHLKSSRSNDSPPEPTKAAQPEAEKQEEEGEAKKATQASEKTNTIPKSSAISSRFVSQYRQLRGKSLADELGEQASSK